MPGIPRRVHQIWWQGEDDVPAAYADSTRALRGMNPGWEYYLWDRSSLLEQCNLLDPQVAACFLSYPHLHQQVDLGRLVVLYNYGGITLDMDITPRRPLSRTPHLDGAEFIVSGSSVGWLQHLCLSGGCLSRACNNSVFLAAPRSPVVVRLICDVMAASLYRGRIKFVCIQWTTGPYRVTQSLRAMAAEGEDIVVLPARYFEETEASADAIVSHHHCNTWVPLWFTIAIRALQVVEACITRIGGLWGRAEG